jgi:Protein of unknown function (DUF1091)
LRRNAVLNFDQVQVVALEKYLLANASIDATKKYLTIYFTPLVTLGNPTFLRGNLWYSENDKYQKLSYLDISINFCQSFKTSITNPLFKAVIENIQSFALLPKKCPIRNVSHCGHSSTYTFIISEVLTGYLLCKGHEWHRKVLSTSFAKQ